MISRAILLVLEGTKRVMIAVSAIFIVILLWGVFSRYVLSVAISWVEELAVMLMIWLVFLGIGVAASERSHIGMPIVRDSLPVPVRRFVILLTNLLMMVFLVLVVYQGIYLAISVLPQKSAAMRLSFFWPYMSIPVGAGLMLLQLLLVAVRDFLNPDRDVQAERELNW